MRRVQQPGKDYRGTQSTHTNRSQQLGTLARTEMSSSLWLHCHKGKGAIRPMVCVERQRWAWGLRTALNVLGPSETQEMPLGLLGGVPQSKGQGGSVDPGGSLNSVTPWSERRDAHHLASLRGIRTTAQADGDTGPSRPSSSPAQSPLTVVTPGCPREEILI